MKKQVCLIAVICCLVICMLGSCTAKNKKTKYSTNSFDYFDTVTVITGYANSQKEFDNVANKVMAELSEYHKLYSIYDRFDGTENLCTVNELVDKKHRTVTVDKKIIDMLLYAKDMYDKTDGIVNIAMGSVLSLWHSYRTIGRDDPENATLPPMSMLVEAAKHTDISNLVIDEQNLTVTITDPKTTLDVGAVAKGYATEQIARLLEKEGVSGYVLNVGGNVRTIGAKGDDEPWVVGIENANGGDYIAYLNLKKSESVVTSGSYQRFYVVDGNSYHHIIHPDTLMPAEGFLSVSVVCNDSGLADALSTALFCMDIKKGKELVESIDGVDALWVDKNGKQTTSSGWNKYLK